MWKVMTTVLVALCMAGCGTGTPGDRTTDTASPAVPPAVASPAPPPPVSPPVETPAAAVQVDFPQPPFNAVTGTSLQYQATQVLSSTPQQSVTSLRYVVTVSIF